MKAGYRKFKLVGYKNPSYEYPSPVVPIGYLNNEILSAVYSSDEEAEIVEVNQSLDYIHLTKELENRLKSFDYTRNRLFALDKTDIDQYQIEKEKEYFLGLLRKDDFSQKNVFLRLSLAKATNQKEIILAEMKRCVRYIEQKSPDLVDVWLQSEKNLLDRFGIDENYFKYPHVIVPNFRERRTNVTMKELLEAGVHFGHQVRRWNPKMKEYIFGERNGIYIIDLQKTQKLFRDALNYVTEAVIERPNMKILFVGTKRQAQDAIKEEAERVGQYYINNRWLGGLMTNFQTVQKSVKKMKDIEAMKEDGRFEMLTKKERLELDREHESLMKNLAGIKDMTKLPDMLFIIDVRKEEIAVAEANRLDIPVVAVVDTNCSPEGIDRVIPGNDDALRAIRLFASRIADAILEGQNVATEGSGGAVSEASNEEMGDVSADTTLEPTIQVAEKSWGAVEEKHVDSTATGSASTFGAYESPEVRSQTAKSSGFSEEVAEAREGLIGGGTATVQDSESEEETNEAAAS